MKISNIVVLSVFALLAGRPVLAGDDSASALRGSSKKPILTAGVYKNHKLQSPEQDDSEALTNNSSDDLVHAVNIKLPLAQQVFIRAVSYRRFCLYAASSTHIGLRPCRNRRKDQRYRFIVPLNGGRQNLIRSVAFPTRCFDANLKFRLRRNDGFKLRLSDCGNMHHRFQLHFQEFSIPAVGHRGMIKLSRGVLCIDVSFVGMPGFYNEEPVSVRTCEEGWKHRQIFKIEAYHKKPTMVKRIIRLGTYLNLCIDITHRQARLAPCGTGFKNAQQFFVSKNGKGPIRWAGSPSECLDAAGTNGHGTRFVELKDCNTFGFYESSSQLFHVPQDEGQIQLYPKNSLRCFDVAGSYVRSGRQVLLRRCTSFGNQQNFLLTGPGRLLQ